MPNPLTLVPSVNAAASKPEAEPRAAEKLTRFQDVLEDQILASEPEVEVEEDEGVEPDLALDGDVADELIKDDLQAMGETPEPLENQVAAPTQEPADLDDHAPGDTDPLLTEKNVTAQVVEVQRDGERNPDKPFETARTETSKPAMVHPQGEAVDQNPVTGAGFLPLVATRSASRNSDSEPVRLTQNSPSLNVATANRSVPNPHVQESGPTLAQMQVMVSAKGQETEKVALMGETDGVLASRDGTLHPTTRDSTLAAPIATQSARADITRAIAGQMAAAIQVRSSSGAVEITLSPEELGRVSIVLNGREDGLHMNIAAERPETLDLMRRHISVLASEFQKLGYGDISFDLGTSADAHPESGHSKAGSFSETQLGDEDSRTEPVLPRTGPGRAIDLRL